MLFSSWLGNGKGPIEVRSALRHTQRPRPPTRRLAPRLCLEG
jgi:hypothetical protein